MTKHHIIVRRTETIAESWARDASSFVTVTAMIGLGVLLDSQAMQWLGAVLAFIVLLAKGAGLEKRHTFDIAGARAEIDRIEAGADHDQA